MDENEVNNSDMNAVEADNQGGGYEEKKGGEGGGSGAIIAIVLILIVIGGLAFYFMTKKPGIKMSGAYDILPQESVFLVQMDMAKINEPDMKKQFEDKIKKSKSFKEKITEFEKEQGINLEKDIFSWTGEQFTLSMFSLPTDKNKPETGHGAIVVAVKDMEKAKTKIKELTKKSKLGYKEETYGKTTIYVPSQMTKKGKKAPCLAFVNNLLVLSGNVDDVKKCIDTADGKSKSLKNNPEVLAALRQLPAESAGIFYMDIAKAAEQSPDSKKLKENPHGEKFVKAIRGLSIGVGVKKGNIVGAGYLGLDKNSDSVIAKAIIESKPNIGVPSTVKLFPKDTSYYAATDIKSIYSIIEKIVKSQQPSGSMDQFKEKFKKEIGLDFDKDIIDNLSGEFAYSIDFVELIQSRMGGASPMMQQGQQQETNLRNIATALEVYATDHNGKYPNTLEDLKPNYLKNMPSPPMGVEYFYSKQNNPPQFIVGFTMDGTRVSREHPYFHSKRGLRNAASRRRMGRRRNKMVPFVTAFKLKDKAKFEKSLKDVVNKIQQKMRMPLNTKDVEGVKVYMLPQGMGGFTVYEDYFILGMGMGMKTMQTIFKNKMDEKKSLASTESFKIIKDKLGKDTMGVSIINFEKVMPLMEMFAGIAAMQKPDQGQAAQEFISTMKQYQEISSYSTIEDKGIKFNFIVVKTKEKDKK